MYNDQNKNKCFSLLLPFYVLQTKRFASRLYQLQLRYGLTKSNFFGIVYTLVFLLGGNRSIDIDIHIIHIIYEKCYTC